ncbi:MAG: cadherin domain-containing protein [Gemmatales bacterium]
MADPSLPGGGPVITQAITVLNVGPRLALDGATAVDEFSPYTLHLSATPAGNDAVTGWIINWGDGTGDQVITGNPDSVNHTYTFEGNYSIVAKAIDADGQYGALQNVTVNNLPPHPLVSGNSVVNQGDSFTLNLQANPQYDAILGWTINWGDGTSSNINGDAINISHTYASFGQYNIAASVQTNGGWFAAPATSVVINYIPLATGINPTILEDNLLTGTLSAVDLDSTNLTFNLVNAPAHGTVVLHTDGSYTYTPNADYNGSDSFTFTANDGYATSSPALVNIAITPVNDAPTSLDLAGNTLAENQLVGTAIGTFTSADPDVGDSFTYTLVGGTGGGDNSSFTIDANGNLRSATSFDFEAKSSYSIRVRTTDAGGLYTESVFSISVTNVNEAPTNIGLSTSSVAENQAIGTLIGGFNTNDPDAGDSFTYTLVNGNGSDDNGSFTIDANGNLKTGASFDYEGKSSYSIRVQTTDAGGLTTEKVFVISVTNVNETPTNIGLTGSLVAENQAAGTLIGTLSSTDPDAGDSFTYSLVSGMGSIDNTSFTIDTNGNLKTAASFDYEAKSSYSIRVRTTDAGGLFVEKNFVINVTDLNESPTGIALAGSTIAENQPAGTLIGSFNSIDPDFADSFSYQLVSGTGSNDNGSFTVDANGNLRSAASFDFEAKSSYSIRVRTTDAGGLTFEKVFTIGIVDVNEAPTANAGGPYASLEGQSLTLNGAASADPDFGDMLTYSWNINGRANAATGVSPMLTWCNSNRSASMTARPAIRSSCRSTMGMATLLLQRAPA